MWRFFWLLLLLPLADVESKNDWVLIKPQSENDWVPIKPHQGREINRHVENPTNFCSCKKYPAFPNLCHCQKYGMKVCIFTFYLAQPAAVLGTPSSISSYCLLQTSKIALLSISWHYHCFKSSSFYKIEVSKNTEVTTLYCPVLRIMMKFEIPTSSRLRTTGCSQLSHQH